MNKKIILSATVVGVLSLAGLAGVSLAQAQGPADQSSLIQKIAEHFGLNQDEVQTVFNEYRQEEQTQRQAEMQTKREEVLSQAVTDGKITQEQKSAILAKEAEMQQQVSELKDLSNEERQTQMTALREEMRAWFESQGIDETQLGLGRLGEGPGDGEHRGPRFGGMESGTSETSDQ